MSDFTALHLPSTIPVGGVFKTLQSGVDYTLPEGSVDGDGFVWLANSRKGGRGATTLGGNQGLNQVCCDVDSEDFISTGSFLAGRASGAEGRDCGISFQMLLWTGRTADPNRFSVLLDERIGASTVETEVTSSSFTVTDPNQVMVFVTGQRNVEGGRSNPHEGMWTADAISQVSGSTYNVTLRRGKQSPFLSITFSIVVIEWGEWWKLQRIEFRDDDPYRYDATPGTIQRAWTTGSPEEYGVLDITAATFPQSGLAAGFDAFADLGRTLFHHQYRIESSLSQGNDDAWSCVEADSEDLIGTSAHVDHSALGQTKESYLITRRRTATGETLKFHVVWALEWNPPEDVKIVRDMKVQHLRRYFDTTGVTPEEQVDDSDSTANAWVPLFSPVDTDRASVWQYDTSSDGAGGGVPRGFGDIQINSSTVLRMVRSESAQEEREYAQIVEWPTVHYPSGSMRLGVSNEGARMDVSSTKATMGVSNEGSTMDVSNAGATMGISNEGARMDA